MKELDIDKDYPMILVFDDSGSIVLETNQPQKLLKFLMKHNKDY